MEAVLAVLKRARAHERLRTPTFGGLRFVSYVLHCTLGMVMRGRRDHREDQAVDWTLAVVDGASQHGFECNASTLRTFDRLNRCFERCSPSTSCLRDRQRRRSSVARLRSELAARVALLAFR